MKKKLMVSVVMVCCLMVTVFSITAVAKNHYGKGGKSGNSYSVCTTKDCNRSDIHNHEGKYYAAHSPEDGHAYHETASHNQGNVSAWGHENDGGHTQHGKSN